MIEVADLSKRFGSRLVVDALNFTVQPGRVTGFLGPNGAGKSTTIRMILGLDRPTRGSAAIDGRPYQTIHRPLHEVGAVLDVRSLHGGRSAYQHLWSLAKSNGIAKRRVDEVLELVGLTDAGQRRAGKFSLGMSQRLGLAGALLGDPSTLICDEPVNGLDPEGILWIRTLLRNLAAEGRVVFVSSHLMSEMALTADHLVVIGQGRLLADASITEVIAGSSRGYALVRTPRADQLADGLRQAGATVIAPAEEVLHVTGLSAAAIGDLAAAMGAPLHELTPVNASLEAAYMELTGGHVDFRAADRDGNESAASR